MARSVLLTVYESAEIDTVRFGVIRKRIVASAPQGGMDAHVFLFVRNPPSVPGGPPSDDFLTVCSPVDVVEFPAGAPTLLDVPPLFRLSEVTLDFRASATATEAVTAILDYVRTLCEGTDRAELLRSAFSIRVGN